MIVVSGLVRLAPESRADGLAAARAMAAASHQEAGCLSYAFYEDIDEPGLYRVFEEWRDDAALQAHFATPHMASFRQQLAGLTILSLDVTRYVVSEHGKIG